MDDFERRARFQAQRDREAEGAVADSMAVRLELMARVHTGEITLEDAQAQLARIKRGAKAAGKITRNQAFLGPHPMTTQATKLRELADRVEGLTHAERVEYEERILAAEMEIVRLTRALKPFAAKALLWEAPDRSYARDSQQIQHRLGDFRAARKLVWKDQA